MDPVRRAVMYLLAVECGLKAAAAAAAAAAAKKRWSSFQER